MAIVPENTATYKDQSLTKHGTYIFRSAVNVGGYDADFVNGPNHDYECPICQFTFRDPVQTRDCGHRFCESCLEPVLRKSPSFCPIDRRPLTRDKRLRKRTKFHSDEYNVSIEKQIFHYIDRASSKSSKLDAQELGRANYAGLYPLLIDSESFPKSNPLFITHKSDAKLKSYYSSTSLNTNDDDNVINSAEQNQLDLSNAHRISSPYQKRRSSQLSWNNSKPLFFHEPIPSKKVVSTSDLCSLEDSFNIIDNLSSEVEFDERDFPLVEQDLRSSINPNVSFCKSKEENYLTSTKKISSSLTIINDEKSSKAKMTSFGSMPLFVLNGDNIEDIDKVLDTEWPVSNFHRKSSTEFKSNSRIIAKVQGHIANQSFNVKESENLSDDFSNKHLVEQSFSTPTEDNSISTFDQGNQSLFSNVSAHCELIKLPQDHNKEDSSETTHIKHRFSHSSVVMRNNGQFSLKESSKHVPLNFVAKQKSSDFFRLFSSISTEDLDENVSLNIRSLLEEHLSREKNTVDAYLNDKGTDGSEEYCVTEEEYRDVIDFLLKLENSDVFPDRACKRTVLSFKVKCYNFGNDCEWIGELGNLQDHLEQCQLIEVACINACGRTDIHRNQMSQHTDADGDCPLAIVACRYSDVGCKFKARRNELEEHLRESIEEHLKYAHLRIRELEIRQETICMNGKFLWKITNYDALMKQSATKKDKEKLCSPPFYTGQYGYKLRAEAFLNGLGQGKGSHLSLYVVIMKGEYDAILPWPFRQNVDFVLIDQDDEVNNRVNKIWKLSCERNSDYFKRPNKSKSLGFGCPKFVSLETLKTRNYIKEQTLFIKIEVEPTDCLVFNPETAIH